MTSETPKRQTRGTIIRGALDELRSRNMFDAVRARVSPEVQAMMDNPPTPLDWLPSRLHDELNAAIAGVAGRDAVRDIAYALTRTTAGPLVAPLIKTLFKVFGKTPAAALNRLSTVTHVQFRGLEHAYEPETDRSGFVIFRYPEPVSDYVYAGWEGALMFGREVTGEPDYMVERFQILEDGRVGRVHVHW